MVAKEAPLPLRPRFAHHNHGKKLLSLLVSNALASK